jgi:phenylpropionate dioxygenase-like ring-hydroxylating dioxygenase large terminal subunit
MPVSAKSTFDYGVLVKHDRVHSSIFTDPGIFEEEMDRIFTRGWVYVGHGSEIPTRGDFVAKMLHRVPLILVRDKNDAVHVLVNRCRHRGNMVCQEERGNATLFVCPYHGFSYANDGTLKGIPRPDGYGVDFRKEVTGLARPPRVDSYRGFVFASLTAEGIGLDEHLGPACKRMIDLFCDASPEGEIELRAGVHKHVYRGNWKLIGMDGYHAPVVHQSFFEVGRFRARESGAPVPPGSKSTYDARDMGKGHAMLDMRYSGGTFGAITLSKDKPWFSAYRAALEQSHGKEWAEQVINASGDPHLHVYPNVELIDSHVRVIQPLGAGETVVHMYPAILKGAPDELNEARLRSHEAFYGPASGGNTDDYEVFERTQTGMMGVVDPWVILSRGLERQYVDHEDATIPGTLKSEGSDEVTQRGMFIRWKADMLQI